MPNFGLSHYLIVKGHLSIPCIIRLQLYPIGYSWSLFQICFRVFSGKWSKNGEAMSSSSRGGFAPGSELHQEIKMTLCILIPRKTEGVCPVIVKDYLSFIEF